MANILAQAYNICIGYKMSSSVKLSPYLCCKLQLPMIMMHDYDATMIVKYESYLLPTYALYLCSLPMLPTNAPHQCSPPMLPTNASYQCCTLQIHYDE